MAGFYQDDSNVFVEAYIDFSFSVMFIIKVLVMSYLSNTILILFQIVL